ncbi:MAG TPA: hypothetical protein VGR72_14895 [Candidatus Acidoferrales bacterium]|nr:hypothetical protein [Candidatus Acidoferrales bacterium]
MPASYAAHHLHEAIEILKRIEANSIERIAELLAAVREGGGRLLFIGVGGGVERNVSSNLVRALEYAQEMGAKICGIVGRDGGYTARAADACVVVPVVNPATITPHTESFQALIWHLLVSHPRLKAAEMKWESMSSPRNRRARTPAAAHR